MSKATILLEEELTREFGELDKLEPTSNEHSAVAGTAVKLLDRLIELEKLDIDSQYKEDQLRAESRHREKQLRADKINNFVKNGITIGLGLLTFAGGVWATLKSIKFEETGTLTTTAGKITLRDLLVFGK